MAKNFIGLSMLVTLISPPGAQVRGIVSGIEPGKSLTLRDVICPSTGNYVPEFKINATDIHELTEALAVKVLLSQTSPQAVATMESKAFEDPAILSVGKRPIRSEISPMATMTTKERSSSWEQVVIPNITSRDGQYEDNNTTASLIAPLMNVSLLNKSEENIAHVKSASDDGNEISQCSKTEISSNKRTRRRKIRKGEVDMKQNEVTEIKKTISKSKGWRQTPMLEPSSSFQPYSTLKRKGKTHEEEGWGTEDANDVQELGDFDFEGGLAKFDKNTLFNQLQAEDSIAEADRLVAHNVKSRKQPVKSSSKNLHYSENVIEKPKILSNSTLITKTEIRGNLDRNIDDDGETSPIEMDSSRHILHVDSKFSNIRRPLDSRPSSGKGILNRYTPSSRSYSVSRASATPAFYIVTSGRRCEPLSPLQMLSLENIASDEMGISEEIMTENAGRNIAEVAFSAIYNEDYERKKSNPILNPNPTVVVLAGNSKSGIRAVAAARHLKNHGLNIVVCALSLEQESDLLAGLKLQIKVFRNLGGTVVNKTDFFQYLRQLTAPVDLIIDGLIGLTISFEELRLGDQSNTYELIAWANKSKVAVLAIDIPTGIDPTNGEVNIIDGRPLFLCPKYVISLGAPKKGLLEAMTLGGDIFEVDGHAKINDWQLFVADIGLGEAVWKKSGTKIRRGIEFEGNWVLRMRFKGAEE